MHTAQIFIREPIFIRMLCVSVCPSNALTIQYVRLNTFSHLLRHVYMVCIYVLLQAMYKHMHVQGGLRILICGHNNLVHLPQVGTLPIHIFGVHAKEKVR